MMDTDTPLERDIVLSKIIDYDIFIANTLRPKIQSLQKVKEQLQEEIAEYVDFGIMRYKVTNLTANEQYKTLVDIGQQCFVKAVVDAPQNGVYVHMGLGFFAELSWSDAADIALKREELLARKVIQTQIAIDSVQADVDEAVQANIQLKKLTHAMK